MHWYSIWTNINACGSDCNIVNQSVNLNQPVWNGLQYVLIKTGNKYLIRLNRTAILYNVWICSVRLNRSVLFMQSALMNAEPGPPPTHSLESLMEGHSRFLNPYFEILGDKSWSVLVCILYSSAKPGLNLPPFEISCLWPPFLARQYELNPSINRIAIRRLRYAHFAAAGRTDIQSVWKRC